MLCRAPSLQSHAPVEYIHGREALEYVNLHNALGAHGVHMEWAVTGKVEGGKFVPDPLVDDTFSDPVYSLGGLDHNNRPIHVQGRAKNPLLEDVSDVVVALIPRPMQWAFAVYATTTSASSHHPLDCATNATPAVSLLRLNTLVRIMSQLSSSADEVFGVLVKEGLLETSKHMFWDGQLQSEVISVSSGDFQIQTANELTEACSRFGPILSTMQTVC